MTEFVHGPVVTAPAVDSTPQKFDRVEPRRKHRWGKSNRVLHWSMALCHPLPLLFVLALAVNDHWLKGSRLLPGWLTGKISDAAGLFFFPALLVTLYLGFRALVRKPAAMPRSVVALSVLFTGLVFSAANFSLTINELLASVGISKVMDPTDLLMLPMLGFAWIWLESRRAQQP